MPRNALKDLLNTRNIKYVTIAHSPAYTAQEVAASAHIKGQELAKTVIVRLDGKTVMCVLPASHHVDFSKLKKNTGAGEAILVSEQEYKELFPGCEPGSQPPFGSLYGLEVLVSESLAQDEEIAFNACSFSELIRLSFDDYKKLVDFKIMDFSVHTERRKAA